MRRQEEEVEEVFKEGKELQETRQMLLLRSQPLNIRGRRDPSIHHVNFQTDHQHENNDRVDT